MNQKKHYRHLYALLILLVPCIAHSNGVERSITTLRGSDIQVGETLEVEDAKTSDIANIPTGYSYFVNPSYTITRSELQVHLKHEEDITQLEEPFELEIIYNLTTQRASGTNIVTGSSYSSASIVIAYDPTENAVYSSEKTVVYEDYDYVGGVLEITDILLDGQSISGQSLAEEIVLDLTLHQERIYDITTVSAPELNLPDINTSISANTLDVKWSAIEGAESYDLEWVFVEVPTSVTSLSTLVYTFDVATRVNVLNNQITLPLLYPEGYIVFRVRAVGLDPTGYSLGEKIKVKGAWSDHIASSDLETAILYGEQYAVEIGGFEPDMNWTSGYSFAEEGKSVEQVSFFDGIGKPRQSLTSFHADGTVLVDETLYDLDGRESIKMVPVPISSTEMSYYTKSSGTEFLYEDYGFYDFGKDAMLSAQLSSTPAALSPTTAYAEYFSAQNSIESEHRDYIPEGDGYLYTQTAYTKDGTGKPMYQSAPGEAYILGDANSHFTKYAYSKPSQMELDRLFGTEVGDKSHYSKTMVRDANGQLTVQYYDNKDRLIASSYAGSVPENLLALDYSEDPITIEENITENSYPLLPETEITLVHDLALSSNVFEIAYDLQTILLDGICGLPNDPMEISYDVLIEVIDEEGNTIINLENTSSPSFITSPNINPTAYLSVGSYLNTVATNISASLNYTQVEEGSTYKVIRKIRVNDDNFQSAVAAVEAKLSSDLATYIQDPTGTYPNACLDFNFDGTISCGDDCETECISSLQFIEDGVTYYIIDDTTFTTDPTNQEYLNNLEDCVTSCSEAEYGPSTIDACSIKREKLLADLSPYGQYFDNLPYEYERDPISGRHEVDNNGELVEASTYDINGWLTANVNSLLTDPSAPWSGLSPSTWDDVRDNWEEDYAEYLLEYHPEYPWYHFSCELESFTYNEPCGVYGETNVASSSSNSITLDLKASREFNELMRSMSANCDVRNVNATIDGNNYTFDLFLPSEGLDDNAITSAPGYNSTQTYSGDYVDFPSCSGVANSPDHDPLVSTTDALFNKFMQNRLLSYYTDVIGPDYTGSHRSSIYYFLMNPDAITIPTAPTINASTSLEVLQNMMYVFHDPSTGALLSKTEYEFFRETYIYWKEVYLYHIFVEYALTSPGLYPNATTSSYNYSNSAGTYTGINLAAWNNDANHNAYIDLALDVDNDGTTDLSVDGFSLNYPQDLYYEAYHWEMSAIWPSYVDDNSVVCSPLGEFIEFDNYAALNGLVTAEQRKVYETNCSGKADEWLAEMEDNGCFAAYSSYTPEELNELKRSIRAKMIEICADGAHVGDYWDGTTLVTVNNPYGHSDPYNAPWNGANSAYTATIAPPYPDQSYNNDFFNPVSNTTYTNIKSVQDLVDDISSTSCIDATYNGLDIMNELSGTLGAPDDACGCDQLLSDIQTNQSSTSLEWYDEDAQNTNALNNNVSIVTSYLNNASLGYTQTYTDAYSLEITEYCGLAVHHDLAAIPDFDGSNTPLVYPQEYECESCKCEKLYELLENTVAYLQAMDGSFNQTFELDDTQNDYDLSALSTAEQTAVLEEINFSLGLTGSAAITSTELYSWPNLCQNSTENEYFAHFPEELRCLDNGIEESLSCQDQIDAQELSNAIADYESRAADYLTAFKQDYMAKAWENIADREDLTLTYELNEYYYTLYYYDQADNLIKTVPPQGVHPIDLSETTDLSSGSGTTFDVEGTVGTLTDAAAGDVIKEIRNNVHPLHLYPMHEMVTRYHYNSLNQMISQSTPDGGISTFWYDNLDRLVASQNAQQETEGNVYSYTLFDALGRTEESGELIAAAPLTETIAKDPGALDSWVSAASSRTEVTKSIYDSPTALLSSTRNTLGLSNENLNGRIVGVVYYEDDANAYTSALHYVYDVHGNIKTFISQDENVASATLKYKRVDYEYDLLSGNVHAVHYEDWDDLDDDEFHHRYSYDANNRLTEVETSEDGENWVVDARYFYYPHGPLERVEIGNKHIQGVDYAYTLHGWLKGVNSATAQAVTDMGQDALATTGSNNLNQRFGNDAGGFTLGYYHEINTVQGYDWSDYTAIGSSAAAFDLSDYTTTVTGTNVDDVTMVSPAVMTDYNGTTTTEAIAYANLFNGNISRITTSNQTILQESQGTTVNLYRYDQANRIKAAKDINVRDASTGDDPLAINNSFFTGIQDYLTANS